LEGHSEIDAHCEISDYLVVDSEVVTSGTLTLEEIAQICSTSKADEADSNSEGEIIEIEERPPITGPVARQGFIQLRQYFEENGLDPTLYPIFDHIEDLLLKDQMVKLKQPKISDFFTQQ
jgi:hypothetical protein